ncbi:MAG TPA: hypothetical protein VJ698_15045 [Noviherbaspirillum sp.]|uniref:hypothetical protein n=1 Tax=Noviherbaspirillum sp. TaxID=1926288 RepID=UPI002B4767DC|nr:hypothetical protein [Noviherbaspirillum sp.]HJV86782.1 hypothetical protein [Noviherbaspirillum sp.]
MQQTYSVESSAMPNPIVRRESVDGSPFRRRELQEPSQTFIADDAGGRHSGKGIILSEEISGIETTSGVQAMDHLHYDIFETMDALSRSGDHEFSIAYEAFVKKIEQAFRQEEQWMDDVDFPASRTHLEQHARVLGALHNVHSRIMDGDLQVGRELVDQLLPQWYAFHLSTMDATLALAMQTTPAESAALAPSSLLAGAFSPF